MKVIFQMEVPVRRKKGSVIDGVDLVTPPLTMRLAPVNGLWVAPFEGDDFRCIERVYEDLGARGPIHVFLKFDGRADLILLKKLGWKEVE